MVESGTAEPVVELQPGVQTPDVVAELFAEYTAAITTGSAHVREILATQGYEDELTDLARKYGPPTGELLVAWVDGQPAGCAALWQVAPGRGELKRLYVRPGHRGLSLGRRLVEAILDSARRIGYSEVVLDTLPHMAPAIRLYESLGFAPTERFNDSPDPEALFFARRL